MKQWTQWNNTPDESWKIKTKQAENGGIRLSGGKHLKKEKRKVDTMIKYAHEKQKAVRFTVNIEGDTQKYAMSFLHIFNNARENHDDIYKVENCYDNRVFVTVNPNCKDEAERYLSQFGEITYKEEITLYIIGFGDGTNWDEAYSDEEQEFILEWGMNH